MSTSITVRRFLETQDVQHTLIPISKDETGQLRGPSGSIAPSAIAKATILKDIRGLLMAVFPLTHKLNIAVLNRVLHRNLELAPANDYRGIFSDCTPGLLPALGEAYGFETIIDDSLLDQDYIYLGSGNPGELLRLTGHDFQMLHSNAWYGNTFSSIAEGPNVKAPPATTSSANITSIQAHTATDMHRRIERVNELPPMPTLAMKIIQLNANPYAHAEELAKLVERDPSVSAQIIRYAQSPFYGYQGQLNSLRQAISRVLGYDMVMNIALGLAAAKPFKLPAHGPLGMDAFWRHATYAATLMQALCSIVPREQRPRPGMSYLTGLLHNFGYLLLGHLFPREFELLHNAVRDNPEIPVIEHEDRLLGINHTEMGGWLMEAWNMPAELIITQRQHHNLDYSGPHANYVHLALIADALLKGFDIGDASSAQLPEQSMHALGLMEEDVHKVMERTIKNREELDTMARYLVA